MSQRGKHTPGPWVVETVPTSCGICYKVGPFPGRSPGGQLRHACLYADYPGVSNPADAELVANAYLIAAAPDLRDALEDMLRICQGDSGTGESFWQNVPVYVAARAALAKAAQVPL